MENGTVLQVLTDLVQILIKLLGRPAVQWQLLAIGLVLVVAWVISKQFKSWLNRRFPAQPATVVQDGTPAKEVEETEQVEEQELEEAVETAAEVEPTSGLSWRERGLGLLLNLMRQLAFPVVALGLAYPALALFTLWNWPGGLIQEFGTILWVFLGYRFVVGLLGITVKPDRVHYYRTRLLLPLFSITVLLMVLGMLTQLSILANAPLSATEEEVPSLTLGTVLIVVVGFYFWFVLTQVLYDSLHAITTRREQESAGAMQATLIIGRYILIIAGAIVVLQLLQLDTTTIAAITGGLSIGLGFAMQDVIKNFLGGIILLFEGTIRPGDWVEVEGVEGEVENLRIRATTIRRLDNVRIIVPNQEWLNSRVTTYTHSGRRALVRVAVGVSYQSDLQKTRDLVIETIGQHPDILPEPEPFAALINFGESSLDVLGGGWVGEANMRLRVAGELRLMIWDVFNEHGIQIPYPQRDVHLYTELLPKEIRAQQAERFRDDDGQ